jgi:hypothetical protein
MATGRKGHSGARAAAHCRELPQRHSKGYAHTTECQSVERKDPRDATPPTVSYELVLIFERPLLGGALFEVGRSRSSTECDSDVNGNGL